MAKRFNEKRRKQMEAAIERELDTGADKIDVEGTMANDLKGAAMGGTYVQGHHCLPAWISYHNCVILIIFVLHCLFVFSRGRREIVWQENVQGREKGSCKGS
jgi:hypothetical protein